jgi:hypothetical protein
MRRCSGTLTRDFRAIQTSVVNDATANAHQTYGASITKFAAAPGSTPKALKISRKLSREGGMRPASRTLMVADIAAIASRPKERGTELSTSFSLLLIAQLATVFANAVESKSATLETLRWPERNGLNSGG